MASRKPKAAKAKPEVKPEVKPEEAAPPASDMEAAGLLSEPQPEVALEPKPEPEPKPAPGLPVPTVEQVVAEGYTAESAARIIEAMAAASAVLETETAKRDRFAGMAHRAHYLVSCPMPRGYWKIGRHFRHDEEELIFADELTAEERAELDNANPLHLTVERNGFIEV